MRERSASGGLRASDLTFGYTVLGASALGLVPYGREIANPDSCVFENLDRVTPGWAQTRGERAIEVVVDQILQAGRAGA